MRYNDITFDHILNFNRHSPLHTINCLCHCFITLLFVAALTRGNAGFTGARAHVTTSPRSLR
jgi:hypothetical protein